MTDSLPKASPRSGLTLIEMLMAMAITLVMMAAVVTLFANLSGSIRNRRAAIEMNSQLRQVRHRLARDLAGCTVPLNDDGLVPWQRAGEAIGYFEIVEGRAPNNRNHSDFDPSDLLDDINPQDGFPDGIDLGSTLVPGSQLADVDNGVASDAMGLGDYDDLLALTIRSESEPFSGDRPTFVDRDGDGTPETWVRTPAAEGSALAEVIWYAVETQPDDPSTTNFDESFGGEPGMRRVYRRQLLIAPWVSQIEPLPPYDPGIGGPDGYLRTLTNDEYYDVSDISFHLEENVRVPNTLADLTRRENRWLHEIDVVNQNISNGDNDLDFPHEFDLRDIALGQLVDSKYLMLNDVLAFDIRVYDPGAPLYDVSGGVVVDPNDAGWQEVLKGNLTGTIIGFGAYVNLGWDPGVAYVPAVGVPSPLFQEEHQAGWHPNAPNLFRDNPSTYDTWTWHYENDRRDQYYEDVDNGRAVDDNGDGIPDRHMDDATDGIDDDGKNGVDDPYERETWPPYNVPLRGVRVILRTYEFDSRQIREASVTSSFVP